MNYNSSLNPGLYNYSTPAFGLQGFAQAQAVSIPLNFRGTSQVAQPAQKEEDSLFSLKNIVIAGAVIAAGVFAHKKGVFSKLFEGEKAATTTSKVVTTAAGDSLQVTSVAQSVTKAAANSSANLLPPELALKIKDKQIELLENIKQGYVSKGNTKMVNNMDELIANNKNGKVIPATIDDLYRNRYKTLRTACGYAADARHDANIGRLSGADTNLIQVNNEGGWYYRIPKNRKAQGWSTNDKSVYRVSVNAHADKNLVKSLDDLFASGEVKGYYKTPEASDEWLERHDPITIYLHENVTPEILQKIEYRTKAHIRGSNDVLVGYKFAPGLALERTPQEEDMKKLIQEAARIHPSFAKETESYLTKEGKLKASAGQFTSVKDILAHLKGEPAHSSKNYKDLDEFLADV